MQLHFRPEAKNLGLYWCTEATLAGLLPLEVVLHQLRYKSMGMPDICYTLFTHSLLGILQQP